MEVSMFGIGEAYRGADRRAVVRTVVIPPVVEAVADARVVDVHLSVVSERDVGRERPGRVELLNTSVIRIRDIHAA